MSLISSLGSAATRAAQIVKDPLGLNPRVTAVLNHGLSALGTKQYSTNSDWNNPLKTFGVIQTAQASTGDGSSDQQSSDSGSNNTGTNYNDIKSSNTAQNNIQSNAQKNAIAAITGNWDDATGSIKDTGKALDQFGNAIGSNLGKAADAYKGAAQNTLDKTNTAIAGNKELINKNQTKDLTTLEDQLRTSVFGANQKLGLMGSGNSSATGAAAAALQKSAGKNRQTTLTQYGDQLSTENQNATKAVDTFNTQKQQINDWLDRNTQQLTDEYNQEKDVLNSLKDKVPSWKQKDIDAMSNNNLNKFASGLQNIYSAAHGYMDTLNQTVSSMFGSADELNNAAIDITPPAELNTPDFTDQLDIPTDPNATDPNATSFTNPNVTGKKRMGYDILGNPYYIDDQGNTVDEQGNPLTPAA